MMMMMMMMMMRMTMMMDGNITYGQYKDLVFRSKIEKWKQNTAAKFGTSETSPVPKQQKKTRFQYEAKSNTLGI